MLKRTHIPWFGLGLLAVALGIAGCTSDGNFRFLGYTTEPLYDPRIHTVYVPIAQNTTFRLGLEFDLTRAVIREINLKTTFRTVACREGADTELNLKLVTWRKNIFIPTPTNQNRQAEVGLGIEVFWKDLRPGRIGDVLSIAKPAITQEAPLPGIDPPPPPRQLPVLLLPSATFEPELGGSNATAEQQAIDRVAVQIVSMMEKSW
jgi:Lipopolysaccharide-assembly